MDKKIRLPQVGDIFTCNQIRSCQYESNWEPVKIPRQFEDTVDPEDFQEFVVYTGEPMEVRPHELPWPGDIKKEKRENAYTLRRFKRKKGGGYSITKKRMAGVSTWTIDPTRKTAQWKVIHTHHDTDSVWGPDHDGGSTLYQHNELMVVAERLNGKNKGERIWFVLHLNDPSSRKNSCMVYAVFPDELIYL